MFPECQNVPTKACSISLEAEGLELQKIRRFNQRCHIKKEKEIQFIQNRRQDNWREDMLKDEKELEDLLIDDKIY